MDTLYYRKIAEIVKRDEPEAEMAALAARVIATGRDGKARIAKGDKRALKDWMRRWCDAHENAGAGALSRPDNTETRRCDARSRAV